MEVQKIKFERTGGFAGMRIAADIEPLDLPEDQARTLLELLDDLDFNELPARIASNPAADQFTYSITVETAKWEHTVVTGDTSAPEKLHELLDILNRLARRQMRRKQGD
jgi:hypothetical protein